MVNLKDLISLVPDLINLFLSGYICISIYAWLNSKKYEISTIILWSLFLSFIIQSLSKCVHGILIHSHSFSTPEKYIIYIILGAILGILITFMRQTKLVKFIVDKTNHKSINSDVFDDIIDYDKKTIMNIYLKNSDIYYMGTFRLREEKGLESWIVLTEYYELKTDNTIVFDSGKEASHYSVAINERDIERIECIYESDSKTWKTLTKS